ncbi:MAG: hypothetical protein ABI839_03495, partial [Verrucomicrobiota bacterium]
FAVRSFGWLYYFDGDEIKIQSPNNLGDLGLHITYIKTFANGVPLWPESPLFVFSKLRYPAGIDLFNGLLTAVGFSLRSQLVLTGLIASAITCYLFYRWAGVFGIAGFLFNGGVVGYHFLHTLAFLDYQGASNISWKSIPLAMFVTQRGLLYAIPAGLLLLWQWRMKFGDDAITRERALPFWVELVLYATLPLFHVHTFLALNVLVIAMFLLRPVARRPLLLLTGAALIPASFFVWLITDDLHAKSVFEWHPGWTQKSGEFAMPFQEFWFVNFGFLLPLVVALIGLVAFQEWRTHRPRRFELSFDFTTLLAAVVIFTVTVLVKTAPWEWDNTKILIWAYFLILPVLWTRMIAQWPLVARTGVCILLFFSGFVSLFGGLAAGQSGYGFASRSEVDLVADAVKPLPITARFAAFPTYNHPLLLNGRKVVCGYPGHLWTQGIVDAPVTTKLQALMLGQGDWRALARDLKVRYIFWGAEEQRNYGASARPWEKTMVPAAKGTWGAIYDLGPPR